MEKRKVKELEIDYQNIDDMLELESEDVIYKLKINGLKKMDVMWNFYFSNLTRDLKKIYKEKGFLFDLSETKLPGDLVNMTGAFYECRSLVKAPEIPESVENMCRAFMGCENLNTSDKFQDTFKKLSNSKVPVLEISKEMTFWMNKNERTKLDEMFKKMGVKNSNDLEVLLLGWKDDAQKELKKDVKQEKKIDKDVRSR